MQKKCKNCKADVEVVNFALGEELMHIDSRAGFPSQQKGTMWRYCKIQVAELEEATSNPASTG